MWEVPLLGRPCGLRALGGERFDGGGDDDGTADGGVVGLCGCELGMTPLGDREVPWFDAALAAASSAVRSDAMASFHSLASFRVIPPPIECGLVVVGW